ncbi:hypothetical protein ACJWSN_26690, partial [Klebsiella pneumoniae]
SDGNGSHASTLKSPSYTKSVSWQHYQRLLCVKNCPCLFVNRTTNCMDVFYISSYIEIAI